MRLAYYDERVIEKMAKVSGVGEGSEATTPILLASGGARTLA